MKYRKKPIVVEAIKLLDNDESIANVIEFIDNIDMSTSEIGRRSCIRDVRENGLIIHTPEGFHKASFGDYIIKGIQGEFYPCEPDIFEMTYEVV